MAEQTIPSQARAITAAGRYEALATERIPYLERSRECSMLTIPGLMPPEGSTGPTTLYQPYQSTGADGVNNLASKLLLALFRPGEPFFRLMMDPLVAEALVRRAGDQLADAAVALENALAKLERTVWTRMESKGNRTVRFEALQHLIVCGNFLVYVGKDGREQGFALDKYVCKRDLEGNPLEIILKESLSKLALPPMIRQFLATIPAAEQGNGSDPNDNQKTIDLYTWVRRTESGWQEHKEIAGRVIPGTVATYPLEKPAWIPLRWRRVSGEDYGRSHCDEYIGDLRTLEALTQFITEFAGAASKIVWLVNPNGVTDGERLAKARSGAFVPGDKRDISGLMLEKAQDFAVAERVADRVEKRLEKAFLLASAVQRNAERVTAEEIRAMIGELENSLGGVYSILSEEYQRPLVVRHLSQQQRARRLPFLPEGTVEPQIITGLEALGRSSDLSRLDTFVAGPQQLFGPEAVAEYVNVGVYMRRRAVALGLDTEDGLIRSEEEVQQRRQQQMLADSTNKLGPSLIGAVEKGAELASQQQPTATT